jgi:hypothetical protein
LRWTGPRGSFCHHVTCRQRPCDGLDPV